MEALLGKMKGAFGSAKDDLPHHLLLERRVCATAKDWLNLFRGTRQTLAAYLADPAGGGSSSCLSAQP